MNHGTKVCQTLKSNRKRIAKFNNIDYSPKKCTFEKVCVVETCQACEEEFL